MRLDLEDVDEILYSLLGSFTGCHVEIPNMQNKNGKPFQPALNTAWCKASIQYANSQQSCFNGNGTETRDWGVIWIQVFTPKGKGTLQMSRLCKQLRDKLNYSKDGLEIYLVHAPQETQDDDFYAKVVRAEFRVN